MGNVSPLSRGDVASPELVEGSSDRGVAHGGVYKVNSGKEPDWWEDNWYKVLTATAVVVGVISTTRKWQIYRIASISEILACLFWLSVDFYKHCHWD